jgi:hypothetical protein
VIDREPTKRNGAFLSYLVGKRRRSRGTATPACGLFIQVFWRDAISDARGGTDVTAAVARKLGVAAVMYPPEVIEIMSAALHAAIESLPEPVSATQVHYLAESILNTASRGERDVKVLVRIALVELRIAPRG